MDGSYCMEVPPALSIYFVFPNKLGVPIPTHSRGGRVPSGEIKRSDEDYD